MSIDQIKSSGLLEIYVLGELSQAEKLIVENAMNQDDSVRQEIAEIERALEKYAFNHSMEITSTVKPMLLASLNFKERLRKGEIPVSPPSLSSASKISEFSQWLEREDMQEPDDYDSISGRILDSNEEKTTLIVWIKDMAPGETHTDEYEKFLVVEGSCDIMIDSTVHSLKRGDYLAIPLYINHSVTVTSSTPCKVILERAAA